MTADLPTDPLPGLNRPLTPRESVALSKYLISLTKWQKAQRLVGSTDRSWLIENVIVDSFRFLGLIPNNTRDLVDIGSGAGIPGVPIAIVQPSVQVVLVEAMRRRASFLRNVIRELPLPNATVLESRVERLGEAYERKFDVAVMRCAGRVPLLLPDVLKLVRKGGVVVAASSPTHDRNSVGDGETVEVSGEPGDDTVRFFRRWST